MGINENFFESLKNFYILMFENLSLLQSQQQKMVEFFFQTQPQSYRNHLMNIYKDWAKNSELAFNNYKEMVIKGIDYMKDVYKKSVPENKEK